MAAIMGKDTVEEFFQQQIVNKLECLAIYTTLAELYSLMGNDELQKTLANRDSVLDELFDNLTTSDSDTCTDILAPMPT